METTGGAYPDVPPVPPSLWRMGAQPTSIKKVFWDGERGSVRYCVAWTGSEFLELVDDVVVDISALEAPPAKVKVRTIDLILNGNLQVDLEYKTIAAGTADVGGTTNDVVWVTGDKFSATWLTEGPGRIHLGESDYTITAVTDDENLTITGPWGNGTPFAYTVDQLIDRFIGQANVTEPRMKRTYVDGTSNAWQSSNASSGFVGDIVLTSVGAASGDELTMWVTFERSAG